MSKEYPLLFPELVKQFNSLDDSDEDYIEDEWEEEGLNYKVIEYPSNDIFRYKDFRVFCYKNNFYRCSFDDHAIEGYMSKELFEKYNDDYFDEEYIVSGEWIEINEDSEDDEVPEGYYSFSIPSIVQLLDGGKKIDNRCINEDHEIDTDWLIDTDEKDFKNIIYGVYGFGKEVLFNDEFVIKERYNG
tara:strand:+ start:223 stop:783 length:561 start_codon:yes stop_codon:yes gene_type:complete